MPPEEAVAIDPGDQVVDLGPVPPAEEVEQEAEIDQESTLAGTGSSDAPMAITGLVVLLIGGSLVAVSARRRRRHQSPGQAT
jgi:LPXTG-motif cell wall-anchored protein